MRIRSSLFQSLAAVGACAMGCAALAAPPTQCPALADLPALHCVSNAQGWFYAGTPDAAADLAADPMATEKLASGIDAFAKDLDALRQTIRARL